MARAWIARRVIRAPIAHAWAVYDERGVIVAHHLQEEVARRIVRAVNAHNALVNACNRALHAIEQPESDEHFAAEGLRADLAEAIVKAIA